MTPLAKKGAPTLLAAVRRQVAAGMTHEEFVQLTAPEFGATLREGHVNGWTIPEAKKGRRR